MGAVPDQSFGSIEDMTPPTELPPMVDVAFAIRADNVQRDCAFDLQQAFCMRLPWMAEDELSGIHPLKVVAGNGPMAMLATRARLLVRVRRERAVELQAMSGALLLLSGGALQLGISQIREVLPHGTLYAYRVAAEGCDESAFMASVAQELDSMGVGGERVCGMHQTVSKGTAVQHAFSLMVHGLSADQSQRLQRTGLGSQRLLGCGIFVPHKSAAAV